MKHYISIFLLSVIFLGSCNSDSEQEIYPTPQEYMTLKIGAWFQYKVDSIYFDDFDMTSDTTEFQLKEAITDTFTDGAGNLSYRLERFKRFKNDTISYDQLPWILTDVWWISNKGNSIERVEENKRFVSLNSPILEGASWDGNAFNFLETWDYTYESVGEPYEGFENTITVNQILEDQFAILYQSYREIYAKNIGLVRKEIIDVESQNIQVGIPVLDRIESGIIYDQLLEDYYIP